MDFTLEKIMRLCSQGNYQEAEQLLRALIGDEISRILTSSPGWPGIEEMSQRWIDRDKGVQNG